MPAKPATRLYVTSDLAGGRTIDLSPAQTHRLRSVLRLGAGAEVALFNGRHGEWLGRIETLGKNSATVAVDRSMRPQVDDGDLWLVFAPIKRARIDGLVEKATELGASALQPAWTERTIVERVNIERLQAIATEAAEQSERLAVPAVHEPVGLAALLASWPANRKLIACDESGRAPPIAAALAGMPPSGEAALLVGPEGGFTETELDALANLPFVTRVGLGPRVLRADTAALAALAVFQAIAGDWRDSRTRIAAAQASPSPLA
jgi:16S rRNA (uracil1498-N3)-methyltransferase